MAAFILSVVETGFAQELCICFDKNTPYIEYEISKDSVRTIFGTTVKGYETEEKRQKAMDAYRKRHTNYPLFITNYLASAPEKITSLEEADCTAIMEFEDFRQHRFPKGIKIGTSSVYFVERLSDGTFLKWWAVKLD